MIVAVVVHPNAIVDAYGPHHQPLPDYSGPFEDVACRIAPLYPSRLWRYEDTRAWAVRREADALFAPLSPEDMAFADRLYPLSARRERSGEGA